MDLTIEPGHQAELRRLSDHPDLDLHLRIRSDRVEGFVWSDGRRYAVLGVRDEEDDDDRRPPPSS